MSNIIERNRLAEQYLCAALKKFPEKHILGNSNSKLLIGHISDIHCDWKRLDNAFELFEYIKPEFVIHTGDLVQWNLENDYSYFYKKISEASFPVFNCIGNHDSFDDVSKKDVEDLHRRFIEPLKGTLGAEKGHYYVDIDKYQVRMIVLNNYDGSTDQYAVLQEQCDWLIEVLKDAIRQNLHVIIASHECDAFAIDHISEQIFCQRFKPCPWGIPPKHPHIILDIVHAFMHGEILERDYVYETIGEQVTIRANFEQKGKFICYLHGHNHADLCGYTQAYDDQLAIIMPCSGCFPEGYHNIGEEISDLPRIPGTVTEDVINFYVIDLENKECTIVRFGACVNDRMEQRIYEKFPLHF